ncbi:hypothetical protein EDB83DRAFT_2658149 [Lactarius deliciosus]|nr:hypothetical protein EDB83DRAFT_2658149 [Lactarius deliciosus]
MYHDLEDYHTRLNSSTLYAANSTFLNNVEWQNSAGGHVLASSLTRVHTVGSLVGRVLDYRFACGPLGTFRAEYGRLHKAKYQLYLAKPLHTVFADDFDKVVNTLETAQRNQATTGDRRHLIYPDGKTKILRFAENVFGKRPNKIEPPLVYMEDYEKRGSKENEKPKESIDFETEHWPAGENQKYLDEIKYEYKATPLRVYGKDGFIESTKVEEQLNGALVELRFDLHHYFIDKEHFHSFNAGIEQIIILQPGEASVPSNYKRKNVRDGPIPLDGSNIDETPSVVNVLKTCPASDVSQGGMVLQRKKEKKKKPRREFGKTFDIYLYD